MDSWSGFKKPSNVIIGRNDIKVYIVILVLYIEKIYIMLKLHDDLFLYRKNILYIKQAIYFHFHFLAM